MGKKTHEKKKLRMAACWARGEKRKDERRRLQDERHRANVALLRAGSPTPWQETCSERLARRAAERAARPTTGTS